MKKNNDLLEELIKENKTFFDEQLPDNHMSAFKAKLAASKQLKPQKARSRRLIKLWPISAAVAIGFIFVLFMQNTGGNQYLPLSDLRPEYRETELYYTSATQQESARVKRFVDEGLLSEEESSIMNKEMEDFDYTLRQMHKELQADPSNQRVISAMIRLYKTRLELAECIADDLENSYS